MIIYLFFIYCIWALDVFGCGLRCVYIKCSITLYKYNKCYNNDIFYFSCYTNLYDIMNHLLFFRDNYTYNVLFNFSYVLIYFNTFFLFKSLPIFSIIIYLITLYFINKINNHLLSPFIYINV